MEGRRRRGKAEEPGGSSTQLGAQSWGCLGGSCQGRSPRGVGSRLLPSAPLRWRWLYLLQHWVSSLLPLQPCCSCSLSQRPTHCWLQSLRSLSSSCLLGLSCHSQVPDFFHIPQFKSPRILIDPLICQPSSWHRALGIPAPALDSVPPSPDMCTHLVPPWASLSQGR